MAGNDFQGSDQEKQAGNSLPEMAGARIISYNFSEGERPGGLRIRAKIRIVTGRKAETLNRVQAEAIRELLLWSRQHRQGQQQAP
jgi:hypothetical protein